MSETNAAVATAPTEASPATPTPTPVQETAAAAAPIEAPKYLNRAEAKRSVMEQYRRTSEAAQAAEPSVGAVPETATPEPVVDATGRAHDPATGKFLPGGQTDALAADTPPVDATTDAPAAPPPSTVRLELPEALREQGRDAIEVPADLERTYRTLLNGYTRRAEVEQLQQELVRLRATQEAREKLYTDPEAQEIRASIEAVREVNPALAALMETGLEQRTRAEADQSVFAAELSDAGNRCEHGAWEIAATRYPPEYLNDPAFQQHFQQAASLYLSEVGPTLRPGQLPELQPERVIAYLDKLALDHPTVRTTLRQMQAAQEAEREKRLAQEAEERVRAEAAERERQRIADATTRHADRNPLAQIAGAVRTDRQSVDTTPSMENIPAHERRRFIKGQLFGGRAR